MADVTLSYKGSDILELSDSGSATLKTGGKYCEADIEVEYVKPSGGGVTPQDAFDKTWPSGGISLTLPQYNAIWLAQSKYLFQYTKVTKVNWAVASGATKVQFPDSIFENSELTEVVLNKTNAEVYVGAGSFQYCEDLTLVSLPTSTNLYTNAFRQCKSLEIAEFGLANIFRSAIFDGCRKLETIVLRGTGVCPLTNLNNFSSTPFASGGTGGTIYIPKALYDHLGDGSALDYKSATNWSTIDGYGTITWAKIEGSYYETHYADGTVIE